MVKHNSEQYLSHIYNLKRIVSVYSILLVHFKHERDFPVFLDSLKAVGRLAIKRSEGFQVSRPGFMLVILCRND